MCVMQSEFFHLPLGLVPCQARIFPGLNVGLHRMIRQGRGGGLLMHTHQVDVAVNVELGRRLLQLKQVRL